MRKRYFGIVCLSLRWISKAEILLLVLFGCGTFHYSYSQSYFYVETKVPQPDSSLQSYFSFLTLQPDGTAAVRIRLANYPLIEQQMADSVFSGSTDAKDLKYLVPAGSPVVFGVETAMPASIRFVFRKKIDSLNTYYVLFQTEYKNKDGKWQLAETVTSREKSYEELLQDKELVSFFYLEDDPFYKYLYGERERVNTGIERKERLFLIVVANTNDPKIGITSQKDCDEILQTFTTLCENLGMKMIATKISGSSFGISNLNQALANLSIQKPAPIDMIVFYYSGHGFRFSDDKGRFPRMSLRTSPDQDIGKNNMQMEDVYNRIVKLGARFNLVVSDCCNNDIGIQVPVGRDILKTRFGGYNMTSQSLNMANCNALFFSKEPISIIATSAEIKQLASGNPAMGGFFSYYFKAFLDKSLYSFWKSDSWLRLLAAAKEKARWQALTAECATSNGRCIQLADFSVVPPR